MTNLAHIALAHRDGSTFSAPAVDPATRHSRAAKMAAFIAANPDLIEYCGRIQDSFTANCMRKLGETGEMTGPQIAAIRRSLERQAARQREHSPRPAPAAAAGIDLSHMPAGNYAVPNGDTRLKVTIEKPVNEPDKPTKWHGWIFVSDGAEYGQRRKYGSQPPGKTYRGMIEKELRTIAADPKAAAIAYGKLTGRCAICGRKLENEESVARGIGPICADKQGW